MREETSAVSLVYQMDGGEDIELEMFDDGEHNDVLAGDGVFANTIAEIPLNTVVTYQTKVVHSNGNINIKPCEAMSYHFQESTAALLKINEFMASNDTTIADEYGDYGDWIELYNADNAPVYLGNKYLTDDLGNPDKWQMPDMYLSANDFVLFWADDDPEKEDFMPILNSAQAARR